MLIVTIQLGLITVLVTLDTMELVYFAMVSICSKREFHYRQYYYQLIHVNILNEKPNHASNYPLKSNT